MRILPRAFPTSSQRPLALLLCTIFYIKNSKNKQKTKRLLAIKHIDYDEIKSTSTNSSRSEGPNTFFTVFKNSYFARRIFFTLFQKTGADAVPILTM